VCGVKPHVLRYWEQEFTQLRPMKRRGNRRYYQHHEVLMIRRIRELLYDQGFTISGARNRCRNWHRPNATSAGPGDASADPDRWRTARPASGPRLPSLQRLGAGSAASSVLMGVRRELLEIRELAERPPEKGPFARYNLRLVGV
jgi:DNA-binding transcriptional MerR regulator